MHNHADTHTHAHKVSRLGFRRRDTSGPCVFSQRHDADVVARVLLTDMTRVLSPPAPPSRRTSGFPVSVTISHLPKGLGHRTIPGPAAWTTASPALQEHEEWSCYSLCTSDSCKIAALFNLHFEIISRADFGVRGGATRLLAISLSSLVNYYLFMSFDHF